MFYKIVIPSVIVVVVILILIVEFKISNAGKIK